MTVWFTSDQHFDHPFMSKTFRGFSRTSKHDDQLIRDWNDVVHRGDCVVVLGDVFWTNYQHITAIWGQLNGSKILVKGNHDHIWLKPTKGLSHHIIYEHNYKVKGGRQHIVACHFPMLSWNKKAHGALHVHGDSHGALPPDWHRMDVGVDVAKVMFGTYRPFSLEEIIYLLKEI